MSGSLSRMKNFSRKQTVNWHRVTTPFFAYQSPKEERDNVPLLGLY